MTLLQAIEKAKEQQERRLAQRCDYCGKTHTIGEAEDKSLLHFYSDEDTLFMAGVIGQNMNDSAFWPGSTEDVYGA